MAETVLIPTTTVSTLTWTVTEVEDMSPRFRYEIIEGVLYMSPVPFWPHPHIVSELISLLKSWVKPRRLGEVLAPQTGLYLTETKYLDPDVLYLRSSQTPRVGERCMTAALAVEVQSPSNLRAPRDKREALFAQAGVEELWYVGFAARSLEIRRLTPAGYETTALFHEDDVVVSDVLPGFRFPLVALWEDLEG